MLRARMYVVGILLEFFEDVVRHYLYESLIDTMKINYL